MLGFSRFRRMLGPDAGSTRKNVCAWDSFDRLILRHHQACRCQNEEEASDSPQPPSKRRRCKIPHHCCEEKSLARQLEPVSSIHPAAVDCMESTTTSFQRNQERCLSPIASNVIDGKSVVLSV